MNVKVIGYYFMGLFLTFAMIMLFLVAISLLLPDTFLRQIWVVKRSAYQQMLHNRILIGSGFLLLAVIMQITAIGWFRRRSWGLLLAIGIFVINGLGDSMRLLTGDFFEGAIGVCTTVVILFYLTRPGIKDMFHKR